MKRTIGAVAIGLVFLAAFVALLMAIPREGKPVVMSTVVANPQDEADEVIRQIAAGPASQPTAMRDDAAEEQRTHLANALAAAKRAGIIYAWEGSSLHVADGFALLPVGDKGRVAAIFLAYRKTEAATDMVSLVNFRTGARVGAYHESRGLMLY